MEKPKKPVTKKLLLVLTPEEHNAIKTKAAQEGKSMKGAILEHFITEKQAKKRFTAADWEAQLREIYGDKEARGDPVQMIIDERNSYQW